MSNIAVILAGGSGTRIGGDIPKQFIEVLGKPILAYTMEVYQNNPQIDAIEIVCHKNWIDHIKNIAAHYHIDKLKWLAVGGNSFQDSVKNGIYNLHGKINSRDIVVIAIGVSPLTTDDVINDSIAVCQKHGNAISAEDSVLCTCIKDDEYCTTQNLIRENIKGFATPWTFNFGELYDAYKEAERRGILESIEPHTTSLYFELGKKLWFSKSNRYNFKITTKEDIEIFKGLIMLKKRRDKSMLSYKEFEVINALLKLKPATNSDIVEKIYSSIHYRLFESSEEVREIFFNLKSRGYISDNQVTELTMEDIKPLEVKNAIILAAGGSDISPKSVYSIPKGLFKKNGETLIERLIRQLKDAGINDITVVVGYKQEMFFFLAEKWNVNLIVNPDFHKNNICSLYTARQYLSSTYICNSDNYFVQNPFSKYEYNSYHAAIFKDDTQNELLVRQNDFGRILNIYSTKVLNRGGVCIYGHSFVDEKFSRRLIKYLESEIEDFRVPALFWEEFVSRYTDNLDMYVREYSGDFILEFDSIQEVQNIDGLFLDNVSARINEKICEVLKCSESQISNVKVLQTGLTNILITFIVGKDKYILRYPGSSSEFFIYRKNECMAQKLATESHADDTCIYIDEFGIKISKFRENCINLHGIYYNDVSLMKRIAKKIRDFHELGYNLADCDKYNYDPIYECERLFKKASAMKGNLFQIFEKEWAQMRKLKEYADKDGIQHTMCHNDINIDNVLLTDETLDIIDWEFAGYNDPGYDFGRVIAGLEYEADEPKILEILAAYFGRPATPLEHLHWMAYSAIHNWYYVGWTLYKESINESSRDWMLFFFKQTKKLVEWCLPKYIEMYG